MTDPASTRRAIEMVLSRVPLSKQTANELMYQRAHLIARGDSPETGAATVDELRLAMRRVASELGGCNLDFGKKDLLNRIQAARRIAEESSIVQEG